MGTSSPACQGVASVRLGQCRRQVVSTRPPAASLQAQTMYDAWREGVDPRQACRSPTPRLSPAVPLRTSEPGKPKHLRAWRTRGHMTELSHTCETAYNLGS